MKINCTYVAICWADEHCELFYTREAAEAFVARNPGRVFMIYIRKLLEV